MLLSVLFAGTLARLVLGKESLSRYIILAAPAVVFSLLYAVSDSIGQGLQNPRIVPRARAIVALVIPFLLALLIWLAGVTGAVLSYPLRWTLGWILALFFLFSALRVLRPARVRVRFDRDTVVTLFPIGINTLLVSLTWTYTTFVTRNEIVHALGLSGAGLFQASSGLFGPLLAVGTSTLSYYAFPKVSANPNNANRVTVINESIAFGLLLVGAGGLCLSVPRELIIRLVFRSDFVSAAQVLPLLALGGVFSITWWVIVRHWFHNAALRRSLR